MRSSVGHYADMIQYQLDDAVQFRVGSSDSTRGCTWSPQAGGVKGPILQVLVASVKKPRQSVCRLSVDKLDTLLTSEANSQEGM